MMTSRWWWLVCGDDGQAPIGCGLEVTGDELLDTVRLAEFVGIGRAMIFVEQVQFEAQFAPLRKAARAVDGDDVGDGNRNCVAAC